MSRKIYGMKAYAARVVLAISMLSVACSSQTPTTPAGSPSPVGKVKKTLVVYLSRTGNTKVVAEHIRKQTGGEIVSLELKTPYPTDYRTTVEQVSKENEIGFLPPLKTRIENIEQYDVVFIGFPTWGMQLPPPMKSFLRQHDLSGKTIVPFNTNGGYGIGSSIRTIGELAPKSKVLEAFTTRGGLERDGEILAIKEEREKQVVREVDEWLRKIGVLQQ